MAQISKSFTDWELLRLQYAKRAGLGNRPHKEGIDNLRLLVKNWLQPFRDKLQSPIFISSGCRCPELNQAVGGAKNSQPMPGQSVDIECFQINTQQLLDSAKQSGLEFDQWIVESHQ